MDSFSLVQGHGVYHPFRACHSAFSRLFISRFLFLDGQLGHGVLTYLLMPAAIFGQLCGCRILPTTTPLLDSCITAIQPHSSS